jgi:hypothetical protein
MSTQRPAGVGRRGRQVDQVAVHPRMGRQDRGQQRALAAAHIDNRAEPAPLHSGDDLRDLLTQPLRHLPVERLTQPRVLGGVGPEVLAIPTWVGRFAGGDAVREFDQRQFGPAGRRVQMQEHVREAGIDAEVRTELRGPIATRRQLDHAEGLQVGQQQTQPDR